jgi:hypothetical protein
MSIGRELLNVPMGDMIRQMASAIAEGQAKLDASSMLMAEMMGGLKAVYDDKGEVAKFDDSRVYFGHEWMTIKEARGYLAADSGLTATQVDARIKTLKTMEGVADSAKEDTTLIRVPTRLSMLELGFSPTFYQFVDTIIEVKIAIKITLETQRTTTERDTSTDASFSNSGKNGGLWGLIAGGSSSSSGQSSVVTNQVDATYSSKYSYSAEGSS